MSLPRLHKSTIIIGLFAAVVAVLLEVPGRVVSGSAFIDTEVNEIEHGWPWVYLRRDVRLEGPDFDVPANRQMRWKVPSFSPPEFETWADLPMGGVPWLRPANWRFWQSIDDGGTRRRDFNVVRLLTDIAVALCLVIAIAAAWEFRRRRRPHILSFGIADMLLAVTAASTTLGWLVYMKNEHRREQQLANDLQQSSFVLMPGEEVCVAPRWYRSLCGDGLVPNFFWRPTEISIAAVPLLDIEAHARSVMQFKYDTQVAIYGRVADAYAALQGMRRLDTMYVGQIDDPQRLPFVEIAKLTQLRKLFIAGKDGVPPEHLIRLEAALPNCKIIDEREDW
jgi:hypothetical protein